jgi:hypothetical protein
LVYLSPVANLCLDFFGGDLASIYLERTPSRAEWKQVAGANPQGGANGEQPFGPNTNQASAAAASRRSP